MRLIDADELTEHAYRDRLDSRELIANMIKRAPTVCDIEQIRKEFKNEAEMYKVIDRQISGIWYEALHIIDKYVTK